MKRFTTPREVETEPMDVSNMPIQIEKRIACQVVAQRRTERLGQNATSGPWPIQSLDTCVQYDHVRCIYCT